MSPLTSILISAAAWIVSAIIGAFGPRFDRLSSITAILASAVGLFGAVQTLAARHTYSLHLDFGNLQGLLVLDPLSSAFLLPTLLLAGLLALYQGGYFPAQTHPREARLSRFFFGLLLGGIVALLVARTGFLFLIAWEIMAIAAFFLIACDDRDLPVRRAAWVYLLATHVGTACLIAMSALLFIRSGRVEWELIPGTSTALDGAIAALALTGFGLKAGLLPFHFWLPGAHAGAPSHVSAILSGVMLNTGLYGIMRITWILPPLPLAFGGFVILLAAATMIYGIANALSQGDFKRLLAYSSMENMGIVLLGVGLALVGRTEGRALLVALGLGGALLHVWNHSLFKALLFAVAGAILHATGVRQLDLMGGLAKRMPRTALLLVVGALAACGLPPLGGFVGEWLLYRGLIGPGIAGHPVLASLAMLALVATGTLAMAAFAKFIGIGILGEARTGEMNRAHDPGWQMLVPMGILGLLCAASVFASPFLWPMLARVAIPDSGNSQAIPMEIAGDLSVLALVAAGFMLLALPFAWHLWRVRKKRSSETVTWDCGYAQGSPRIQYTGTSFAGFLDRHLPGTAPRRLFEGSVGADATASPMHLNVKGSDQVGDQLVEPMAKSLLSKLARWHRLQQGVLQVYLLYIVIAMIVALTWAVVRTWLP